MAQWASSNPNSASSDRTAIPVSHSTAPKAVHFWLHRAVACLVETYCTAIGTALQAINGENTEWQVPRFMSLLNHVRHCQ